MKDGFESLGRVRLQGLALLALALGAGVLGGMALERLRLSRAHPEPRAAAPMRGDLPPGFGGLALTPEQRDQIQAIFRASRPRTDSVLRGLDTIHDAVRAEIRTVLTPDQQRQFDEMESHRRRGRMGMRGRPGPPDPPR